MSPVASLCYEGIMSTLAEIEAAVETLPRRQQQRLLRRLSERLASGPSCYDLARDLFEIPGMIDSSGKGDLSSNKAYLESFGKNTPKPKR